jgi:hypothetical protein
MPQTLDKQTRDVAARDPSHADLSRASLAHRLMAGLFERYYGRSVSDLATALDTTRDTVRAWLAGPRNRPREELVQRAQRLWILCRSASRYILGGRKIGEWTLSPHIGLGGLSPSEALLDSGQEALDQLLNEMVLYAPARPDLSTEATEEELLSMMATSLGPETMARVDQIMSAPALEVTDEDLADLSAFDDETPLPAQLRGRRTRDRQRRRQNDRVARARSTRAGRSKSGRRARSNKQAG